MVLNYSGEQFRKMNKQANENDYYIGEANCITAEYSKNLFVRAWKRNIATCSSFWREKMGTSLLLEMTTTMMMLHVACHFAGDALCSRPIINQHKSGRKLKPYRCCIFKEAFLLSRP